MERIVLLFHLIILACSSQTHTPVAQLAIEKLWNECALKGVISYNIFETAILGYNAMDGIEKENIITIIDFSKPSTQERFYVIDIQQKKLLYRTLVAHGKNTGWNYAEHFSNTPKSLKSSLGFFLTAETYTGKHGHSLKLDGLEKGINDNARDRAIVIHGADYVSDVFAQKNGRLGRSWGCPALPQAISKEIINTIAEGSCLFIYANDASYQAQSTFIQ